MSDRYTIMRTNGCIVIEGAIPVDDLVVLMKAWEKHRFEDEPAWIVDSLLSEVLKCNMVIGPPAACQQWRERLKLVVAGQPRSLMPRYRLVDEPYAGITCLSCGMTSYNANDIKHRYCGNCKNYLDDQ
jgi:hypothetical protein